MIRVFLIYYSGDRIIISDLESIPKHCFSVAISRNRHFTSLDLIVFYVENLINLTNFAGLFKQLKLVLMEDNEKAIPDMILEGNIIRID